MISESKQLSNPFSTGGGGSRFETNIQAAFVTLMLTKGYMPCLINWPIIEIKLQGKIEGYSTDDLIVTIQNQQSNEKRKFLGQIKHSISITENNSIFSEVIKAAWDDFNNSSIFKKGKDVIALITGPLSATDVNCVNFILEQAKYLKDEVEFFNHINQSNFSSKEKRKKLKAFQIQLKKANNNIEVSDRELFEFLKHFYLLGYDLDKKASVVSSLLQSHISQYNKEIADKIWSQIITTVQDFNQQAGTITLDTLPEELISEFVEPKLQYIPNSFNKLESSTNNSIDSTNWQTHPFSSKLALLNLVGFWNEKNQLEVEIVSEIVGLDYKEWITELRELLHISDTLVSLKNGIWKIKDRKKSFELFSNRIYDDNLDIFKNIILKVLKINDPSFELPKEERYAASIYGKILPYSNGFRDGLVSTLALIGNKSNLLINCSREKPEQIVNEIVEGIFNNADSVLWGSLDGLLPSIAESSPDIFLKSIEHALSITPCPFEQLFKEEDSSTFGRNYMTGLLWALEGIAWEEKYLIKVCVILAELASYDPGGNWANRPINSLKDIFLPWLPHTLAPFEKRKVALKTIVQEEPTIAWNLLDSLLNSMHSSTTGTYKPKYREVVPTDWKKTVSNKEYWEQIDYNSMLLLELADSNILKLSKLADKINQLSINGFNNFIKKVSSKEILELDDETKNSLWTSLERTYIRNNRFSDATWALKKEDLEKIKDVLPLLAPRNPYLLYENLFTQSEHELYEERGNYEEQSKNLFEKRKKAIEEIINTSSFENVLIFMKEINKSSLVGQIVAGLNNKYYDQILLPKLLTNDDKKELEFISSYISYRAHTCGFEWFDKLDKIEWSIDQIAMALCFLPFKKETWDRVEILLNEKESKYWKNVDSNVYQIDLEFEYTIKKFLKYKRPYYALEVLSVSLFRKEEINVELACETLISLANSPLIGNRQLDSYHITELIKYLQEDKGTNQEKLLQIELLYISFLTNHSSETRPKILEQKFAIDPELYCELIRLIYKPEGEEIDKPITEAQKNLATNAYHVLSNLRTVPGIDELGNFKSDIFNSWIDYFEESTKKSGHYKVAMIKLGEILVYSPEDTSGLYINKEIARYLNKKENEDLRHGYDIGTYNSRGVHFVDYKEEIKLAELFNKRAENIENESFFRFAITLRNIAKHYFREAERIKEDY
jgi:hypothetical protein